MRQNSSGYTLAGFCIAIGLIAGSVILGSAVLKFKQSDRYVTVKGLVERDVPADLAVWTLRFAVGGNDLPALQQQIEQQQVDVTNYLKASGLKAEEIIRNGLSVINRQAQEYTNNNINQPQYMIKTSIAARSTNTQAVYKASQNSSQLISKGIALQEDSCTPGPSFSFTGLNDIKPDMLAEATKNAKLAADEFAKSSGSEVGAIRFANQGVFSVMDRDRAAEGGDNGGCGNPSDMFKRVRVVTTINYSLKD
jgi:uncharacterized protein